MISVAMCTYNGSKYLLEQLLSIIHQTQQPDEIVICDDCSQDNSVVIAKSILSKWSGKIQIIENNQNLGFRKNFQKAIELCHGDIIFLSDQDDVWSSDKIALVMHVFDSNPEVSLVFHDAELVDSNLDRMYPSFWRDTLRFDYRSFLKGDYRRLLESNVVQGSASAFRKEVYKMAAPFPPEAYHDEWLALVALIQGKLFPLPNRLMKYRQDQNALGGLPTPLKTKILNWTVKMSDKCKLDFNVLKRQHVILSTFVDRYSMENSGIVHNISHYNSFLNRRIQALQQKNVHLLCKWKEYYTHISSLKFSIRFYCRDVLEIFLMKILQN